MKTLLKKSALLLAEALLLPAAVSAQVSVHATTGQAYSASDPQVTLTADGAYLNSTTATSLTYESQVYVQSSTGGDSAVTLIGIDGSLPNLTELVAPTITTIKSTASLPALVNANFPNVTTLESGTVSVFCPSFGTTALTTANFPKLETIEEFAFYYCDQLTSVYIPEAKTIGKAAFESCNGLTSVSFPKVTKIGELAFNNCAGLSSISFPEATTIGISAFNNCKELTSASFPKVTTIENNAFNECNKLTSISFPKATTIGKRAFDCYTASADGILASIYLPEATTIGESAFRKQSSLTKADLPKVTTIGESAFSGCSDLATVIMPSVTSIGDEAFKGCNSNMEITVGGNVPTVGSDAFANVDDGKLIFVPNDGFNAENPYGSNWLGKFDTDVQKPYRKFTVSIPEMDSDIEGLKIAIASSPDIARENVKSILKGTYVQNSTTSLFYEGAKVYVSVVHNTLNGEIPEILVYQTGDKNYVVGRKVIETNIDRNVYMIFEFTMPAYNVTVEGLSYWSEPSDPIVSRKVTIKSNVLTSHPVGYAYVGGHQDFTFTVYCINDIKVSTTRNDALGGVITKNNNDGTWTVTIKQITEVMTITVDGLTTTAGGEETGNAATTTNKIWSANGTLYISAAKAGQMQIYSITGQTVRASIIPEGTTTISNLSKGIYIVKAGNLTQKVVITK